MLLNHKYEVTLPAYRAAYWNIWHEGKGGWEVERTDAVVDAIIPGKTLLLDIGAEQGDFTSLWSNQGADVVAVEASPAQWPGLKTIWDLNSDEPPFASVVALVDDKVVGDPEIHIGAWPSAVGGKVDPECGFFHLNEHGGVVPQVTIDYIVDRLEIPELLIINMDIEGSELSALKGAEKTFLEYNVKAFISVHPEIMADRYNESEADVLEYMEGLGFSSTWLAGGHEEMWVFVR